MAFDVVPPATRSAVPGTLFDLRDIGLVDGDAGAAAAGGPQDRDLATVTFVVVDLETTGGSVADAGITEIGAVKVRGGEVLGEFTTLVRPDVPIPAFIRALTGITDELVADAPARRTAVSAFWDFAGDAVLVAHNAPYDIGFLRAAGVLDDRPWPEPLVLDTVTLARHLLGRGEVRNNRLETLAAHFRTPVLPCHRALDDARATVAVFHGLLERAGSHGLRTLYDLQQVRGRVDPERRAKRGLAADLPTGPGVYVFEDAQGEALYVGTATNIRARVQNYFTASETRRRITEMLMVAHRVHPITCATPLEAHLREIRTIHQRAPRYNQRSRRPETALWLTYDAGARSRLRLVRGSSQTVPLDTCIGPFTGREEAHQVAVLVAAASGVAYTGRGGDSDLLPAASGAPAAEITALFAGDVRAVAEMASAAMGDLAGREAFELARRWRDRLRGLCRAVERVSVLRLLAGLETLVAAEPDGRGGWQIHVISHGRLVAAGVAPAGSQPRAHAEALLHLREQVTGPGSHTAALTEEVLTISRWLFSGRVRLVSSSGAIALPIHCGGAQVLALPVPEVAADHAPVVSTRRPGARRGTAPRSTAS